MSPTPSVLRLGTRSSRLALAQSSQVARALEQVHRGLRVELVPIVTRGDRHLGDLAEVGGKGLFTEELEAGIADGTLDLAVHSLKDLPVHLPQELAIAAYPRRADPRDLLISDGAPNLRQLPSGSSVLTGSLRRRAQILGHRPDLEVIAVRGNIDTRLQKWRRGDGDAVVLAAAGIRRLREDQERAAGAGLDSLPFHALSPLEEMLPAPGQGTLALQTRASGPAFEACAALDHPDTRAAADAERRIVAALGGDCTLPLAAWARREEERWHLDALLADPGESRGEPRTAAGHGRGESAQQAAEICLTALEEAGVQELLEQLRRSP
ncbi:MAG: hydroxymethylbilane synthase [Acidobacteriota bacterium]